MQVVIGRLGSRGQIVGDKFEFLPEAPAHDHIVAIEPYGQGFAIGGLFANVITDEPSEFFLSGRTLPGAREPGDQILDRALCHHDLSGFIRFVPCRKTIDHKNCGPQKKEME